MLNKRIAILTIAAIILAALGAQLFWSNDRAGTDVNDATFLRPDETNAAPATEEVDRRERTSETAQSNPGIAEDAPQDAGGDAAPALADSSGTVRTSMKVALAKTEREFGAEDVDPLWSTPMEARILGEIAQISGLEALTVQVQCHTSMCRIELAQRGQLEPGSVLPANAAFGQLVLGLDQKPLWIMTDVDSYGTPNSLAYVARDHLDAPRAQIQ